MSNWWDGLDDDHFTVTLALDILNLPSRKYAVAKWRSNNLAHLHGEDLASIALLALVEAVHNIDDIGGFRGWKPLWGYVKSYIDSAVQSHRAKWANNAAALRSITVTTADGQEIDPATVFTGLRAENRDGLLHSQLADKIAVLPTTLKIALALRFYEQLSLEKIGGMVGATKKPAFNWTTRTGEWLLHEAKKLTLDTPPTARVTLPTVADEYATALLEAAGDYVWRRYGTDVPSWLGWVQICYRVDVSYILDMLDTGNHRAVRNPPVRLDYQADVEHLDTLNPPPVSRGDVRRRTGWSEPRSMAALSTWRRKHGIDTPKNGNEARNQAREWAA